MKFYDIPINLCEALFNHTVVHSTDNIVAWRFTKYLHFGWTLQDKRGTWYQVLHRLFTTNIWIRPIFNPYDNLRIRDIKQPFYQQLYSDLKHLDAKYGFNYSDDITCSVAY